jgi:hypothetical protein
MIMGLGIFQCFVGVLLTEGQREWFAAVGFLFGQLG